MEGTMQFTDKYILTFATDKDGLKIYGPFESGTALAAWGNAWQERGGDDPRWQQIGLNYLDEKTGVYIEIEAPSNV
jgi:hypothetical protein